MEVGEVPGGGERAGVTSGIECEFGEPSGSGNDGVAPEAAGELVSEEVVAGIIGEVPGEDARAWGNGSRVKVVL